VRVCVGRRRSLVGGRRCRRAFRGRLSYDAFDVVLVEDVDVEVDWQYDIDVPKVRYCRFFLSDSERQESDGDGCKVEIESDVDIKLSCRRRRRRRGVVRRRRRWSSSQMSGAQICSDLNTKQE
jgi:hypothetical protein